MPAIGGDAWYGVLDPRNVPASRVEALHRAFACSLSAPEIRSSFAKQGLLPREEGPQQMRNVMRAEQAKWVKIAKTYRLQLKQD